MFRRLVRGPFLWVGLLLLAHGSLLAWSATLHSPTGDEIHHLPSGLAHLQFGSFVPYRVNPPLVRLVAAVPVFLSGERVDPECTANCSPGFRPEAELGWDFLRQRGPSVCRLFVLARWACLPFSLLGGFMAWRWAQELWGYRAGLLSLGLWCLDPNILAHGQIVTPDLGASACGLAAGYAFWRWLQRPDGLQTALLGLALGVAELTKATWVVLYPAFLAAWLLCRCRPHGLAMIPSACREAGMLGAAFLLSLLVLNIGYGFDQMGRRLGDFDFVSATLAGEPSGAEGLSGNRFRGSWFAELPVPVPADYLLGIDTQKRDFERQQPAYLRGVCRRGGWWYYYLYALMVKVPLGTWLLFLLGSIWAIWQGMPSGQRGAAAALLIPAIAVLILVSSQTGINAHFRYALPALPFLLVWASQAACFLTRTTLLAGIVVLVGVVWSSVSSLSVYPHSLSYFNELAGGPLGGHNHLLDSNMEWAQDYLFLREWQERHPQARPFRVHTFGYDPQVVGVHSDGPPPRGPRPGVPPPPERSSTLGPQPGWYALSVTYLHGNYWDFAYASLEASNPLSYEYFRYFRPVARAGYSVYIYHITPDDANRVRHELGLHPLPDSPSS